MEPGDSLALRAGGGSNEPFIDFRQQLQLLGVRQHPQTLRGLRRQGQHTRQLTVGGSRGRGLRQGTGEKWLQAEGLDETVETPLLGESSLPSVDRPQIGLVAGSGPVMSVETAALLRDRLRVAATLLASTTAFFILRQRRVANPVYDLKVAARSTFWVAALAPGATIPDGITTGPFYAAPEPDES